MSAAVVAIVLTAGLVRAQLTPPPVLELCDPFWLVVFALCI